MTTLVPTTRVPTPLAQPGADAGRNPAFQSTGRLLALFRKKRAVELEIHSEMSRPVPCNLTLQSLKRKKLALKDAAARIRERNATRLGAAT
ncbi:MAG: YdcH family protein [Pseudomonadota bacterium]